MKFVGISALLVLFSCYGALCADASYYQMDFGEITLGVTANYKKIWDDVYSGATAYGSFWEPIPMVDGLPEVRPLGHVGSSSVKYHEPTTAALLVRPSASANTVNPPLADPVDWTLVYTAATTGASHPLTVWAPVCRQGYSALGLVAVPSNTGTKPATNIIYTVRKDLVQSGAVGAQVWSSKGARGPKAAFYAIVTGEVISTSSNKFASIAPNSFFYVDNFDAPLASAIVNVLLLPCPTEDNVGTPPVPQLNSFKQPAAMSAPILSKAIYIPMTAVADPQFNAKHQALTSPFYKVQRFSVYSLQMFQYNQSPEPMKSTRKITFGLTTNFATKFSSKTGITVSTEGSVGVPGIFSGSLKLELSLSLGYAFSKNVESFRTQSITSSLYSAPNTATALWVAADTLEVVRRDGSVLFTVEYNRDTAVIHTSQYPRPVRPSVVLNWTLIDE